VAPNSTCSVDPQPSSDLQATHRQGRRDGNPSDGDAKKDFLRGQVQVQGAEEGDVWYPSETVATMHSRLGELTTPQLRVLAFGRQLVLSAGRLWAEFCGFKITAKVHWWRTTGLAGAVSTHN
jgi:hypothetical protein